MPRSSFGEFSCSIARTVDVVGDSWTPLIVRDMFLGVDTFAELVRDLGIPRALLSTRLEQLAGAGIIGADLYSEHPPRRRYRLTESGLDLIPILVALMQWGDKWRAPTGPPMLLLHDCGHSLGARLRCNACGSEVTADTISPRPGPGGRRAPGTKVIAELLAQTSAIHKERPTT